MLDSLLQEETFYLTHTVFTLRSDDGDRGEDEPPERGAQHHAPQEVSLLHHQRGQGGDREAPAEVHCSGRGRGGGGVVGRRGGRGGGGDHTRHRLGERQLYLQKISL